MSRGRGTGSTCSFCGERGHNATDGTCSRSAVGARLITERGLSLADASRIAGCTPQAVSQRIGPTSPGRAGRRRGVKDRQSASYRAALFHIEHGASFREAAERFGVTPVTVHLTVARHFKGVRAPQRPFPEDECTC